MWFSHFRGYAITPQRLFGSAWRHLASRRDWQQLSAAHQQLNFKLTQVQQENDKLCARRFQLELEIGDRLQRIVDLEAENHTLEENADAHEIERLMLLQNIADM
jgi:predicted nuclease with TOPRIM domain